jgi:hypothetical protein
MEALIILIFAITVTGFMMSYCIFFKLENIIDELHQERLDQHRRAKKSESSEHDK